MAMGPATRRQFLKSMSALSVGGAAGFAANLAGFNAFAADASGYKALVCVFFYGGLDCHDTVIPYDPTSYNQWADIRRPLVNQFGANRSRANLLPLTGADIGGRSFAFPPQFGGLHDLYNQGRLAVVGNVGPLVEPTTRTALRNGLGRRPDRLFSHNDQQSTWMASEPEGARYGWGGRLADVMITAGANPAATFTAVSSSGNAVFLSGEYVRPFQVGRRGAATISSSSQNRFLGSNVLPGVLDEHFRDLGANTNNLFQQDMINARRRALDANEDLAFALETPSTTTTPFPQSRLGGQLSVVAQMIAQQNLLQVNRQVFFVAIGGFDTHSDQANDLTQRHIEISNALTAFYYTLDELGVAEDVTTFTASDFGRTLFINGDGTDHGWGGHHLVMGGAVQGGQILGDIPEPAFDHEADIGGGRLIPAVSVDQYAAALGRWFGLSDGELADALPGLSNFDANGLNGLFV